MSGRKADGGAPQRRSSHIDHGVVYAAVGASGDPELLRFPPGDSTPYEFEQRLGSGEQRFLVASSALMTWGAQRGVGIRVRDVDHGDGGRYAGVAFDERGTPQPLADPELQYGPDGEPYVTVGTTVTLHWPDGRAPRRIRVLRTVNEAQRVGFAWGSADAGGVTGEQLLSIEFRDDGTVWAVARGFHWAPEGRLLGSGKGALKQADKETRAQLAALATGVAPAEG